MATSLLICVLTASAPSTGSSSMGEPYERGVSRACLWRPPHIDVDDRQRRERHRQIRLGQHPPRRPYCRLGGAAAGALARSRTSPKDAPRALRGINPPTIEPSDAIRRPSSAGWQGKEKAHGRLIALEMAAVDISAPGQGCASHAGHRRASVPWRGFLAPRSTGPHGG
jgi:hypothetical protein